MSFFLLKVLLLMPLITSLTVQHVRDRVFPGITARSEFADMLESKLNSEENDLDEARPLSTSPRSKIRLDVMSEKQRFLTQFAPVHQRRMHDGFDQEVLEEIIKHAKLGTPYIPRRREDDGVSENYDFKPKALHEVIKSDGGVTDSKEDAKSKNREPSTDMWSSVLNHLKGGR